jgi:hypothetical protein
VNVKALDIHGKGVLAATGNDKRRRVLAVRWSSK